MLKKMIVDIRSYFQAHDLQNTLTDLSDAALDDIGLTRTDISGLSARFEPVPREAASDRDPLFASLAFPLGVQSA